MKEVIRNSLRKRLLSLMSDISEECYCAGWLHGLEYSLWSAVLQYPKPYQFGFGVIDLEQVEELKALSEELQEWGVWAESDEDERIISLDEWKARFAEMEKRRQA